MNNKIYLCSLISISVHFFVTTSANVTMNILKSFTKQCILNNHNYLKTRSELRAFLSIYINAGSIFLLDSSWCTSGSTENRRMFLFKIDIEINKESVVRS